MSGPLKIDSSIKGAKIAAKKRILNPFESSKSESVI